MANRSRHDRRLGKGRKYINFICPECGHHELVIVEKVDVFREVIYYQHEETALGLDTQKGNECLILGEELDSGDRETLRFECNACYFKIGDSEQEAIEWLKNHGMVDE